MSALLLFDLDGVLLDFVCVLNFQIKLIREDLFHSLLFFFLLLQPDFGRVERQGMKLLILRDVHGLALHIDVAVTTVDRRASLWLYLDMVSARVVLRPRCMYVRLIVRSHMHGAAALADLRSRLGPYLLEQPVVL